MKRLAFARSFYALAILLAVACGKDNGNGTNNNPTNPPTGGDQITSYDQITAARDRGELVGKRVNLSSVPVSRVVGTYTFWIGDPGSGIPVVRQDRIEAGNVPTHVRAGGHANITGDVRLASAVDSSDPMWSHISSEERRDIENARVFIRATRVEPLQ